MRRKLKQKNSKKLKVMASAIGEQHGRIEIADDARWPMAGMPVVLESMDW